MANIFYLTSHELVKIRSCCPTKSIFEESISLLTKLASQNLLAHYLSFPIQCLQFIRNVIWSSLLMRRRWQCHDNQKLHVICTSEEFLGGLPHTHCFAEWWSLFVSAASQSSHGNKNYWLVWTHSFNFEALAWKCPNSYICSFVFLSAVVRAHAFLWLWIMLVTKPGNA
jgi:hypothetical protein